VSVQAFQVVAASGADTESTQIVSASGTFTTTQYTATLPINYAGPSVFFNVELTPNVNLTTPGLQSFGFTILLNQKYPISGITYFPVSVTGNASNIEFNNWLSDPRVIEPNVVLLNVSEVVQNADKSVNYTCMSQYQFTFLNPIQPPGTGAIIVGDPQFVGLRGQSYQVHGIDGAVYNIISEENTQVNSRFVFLTEGQCPMLNGKQATNCWSHPGSYLGEMSFQAMVDGELHAALVQSGSAQTGFAGVQVDGKALQVGDKKSFGAFSVELVSTHEVAITTENFNIRLSNSDNFINQELRATTSLSKLRSHGLLGQTHSIKTYSSALKHVEGDIDDYVIEDNDIFGTSFVYNRFQL